MSHDHAPHEEAEHAAHHAQDPFDKRVAMTMVIIAALLAAVKIQGHRAHNDTLGYVIHASVAHTKASNLRAFFQAKRQRMELAALQASQIELMAPRGMTSPLGPLPDRDKTRDGIAEDLAREGAKEAGAKADEIVAQGEARYAALGKLGYGARHAGKIVQLEMNVRRYRLEADAINARAEKKEEEAKHLEHDSEHTHHQSSYFDLGELGVDLGLVLCSVAILTKRREYWFAGMVTSAIGAVVVLFGFLA